MKRLSFALVLMAAGTAMASPELHLKRMLKKHDPNASKTPHGDKMIDSSLQLSKIQSLI